MSTKKKTQFPPPRLPSRGNLETDISPETSPRDASPKKTLRPVNIAPSSPTSPRLSLTLNESFVSELHDLNKNNREKLLEADLRKKREEIADLKRELADLEADTISVKDARELTYKALYKGAALQRLATLIETFFSYSTEKRLAFRSLAFGIKTNLSSIVNVHQALTDGLNRRGWESHLQMMRQEQLTLLAENRLLFEKVNHLQKEDYSMTPHHITSNNLHVNQIQLRHTFHFFHSLRRITALALQRRLFQIIYNLKYLPMILSRHHLTKLTSCEQLAISLHRVFRCRILLLIQYFFYRLLSGFITRRQHDRHLWPQHSNRLQWDNMSSRPHTDGLLYDSYSHHPSLLASQLGHTTTHAMASSYLKQLPSIQPRTQHSYIAEKLPPLRPEDRLNLLGSSSRYSNKHDELKSSFYRPDANILPSFQHRHTPPVGRRSQSSPLRDYSIQPFSSSSSYETTNPVTALYHTLDQYPRHNIRQTALGFSSHIPLEDDTAQAYCQLVKKLNQYLL